MKCVRCGHDDQELVTAEWTFVIERDPPSLNARIFNAGPGHRGHVYRADRDAWCWLFRDARLKGRLPTATGRRRVTLTRLYTGRQKERDYDNLVGGMKSVVDAMVAEKMLIDDSPTNAEISYGDVRIEREIEVNGPKGAWPIQARIGLRVRIECVGPRVSQATRTTA